MKAKATIARAITCLGQLAAYHADRNEEAASQGMFMGRWLLRWVLDRPPEVKGEENFRAWVDRMIAEDRISDRDPVQESHELRRKANDN